MENFRHFFMFREMKTKKMIEMKDGIVILTWMLIGILLWLWSSILIACLSRLLIVFFLQQFSCTKGEKWICGSWA